MDLFSPIRRRRFLIDKGYQLYYPLTWIAMVGLALVNFVMVNVLLVIRPPVQGDSLIGMVRIVAKVDAAVLLLASAWMGFASILHSHRIAGAIYNISRALKRVIAGDTDVEIRLRKEDFSTHVAQQINALIAQVEDYRGRVESVTRDGKVRSGPGSDESAEAGAHPHDEPQAPPEQGEG